MYKVSIEVRPDLSAKIDAGLKSAVSY